MINPWDRIVNGGGSSSESRKAYLAFCVYRDMGPERSVQRASEVARGLEGVHTRSGRWHLWATRWHWVARADQWDAHQEQLKRAAEEKAMSAHYEKLATERLAYQEIVLDLVKRLIAQAITMLTWPLQETTINNEDGTTIIKPVRWSKSDIPRFIEVADKLFRLTTGLETERYAIQLEEQVRQAAKEMAEERGLDVNEVMADVETWLHTK